MAYSGINNSLCNKILGEFDSLIAPGIGAKNEINSLTSGLSSQLSGLSYSDSTSLNIALTNYQSDVNLNLPGTSESYLRGFKNFLDNCSYLSRLSPVSAMLGTLFGIYNKINSLIGVYNTSYPEFSVGNSAYGLDNLLNKLNISQSLGFADNLLNCLDFGCAAYDSSYSGSLSSMTADLDGLYNDLNIVSDTNDSRYGLTNYQSIYSGVGMSDGEILQMESVRTNIEESNTNALTSVTNSVAAIKDEIKFGTIFT